MFRKTLLIFLCFVSFSCRISAQDTSRQLNIPATYTMPQLFAPVLLISSGLALSGHPSREIADWSNRHLKHFNSRSDDFLAVAPILVVYGLDIAGIKARNDFLNRSAILCKGELMMLGSVYLLKNTIKEYRPDGSDAASFPSAHSAQAFLAATFLSMEYKQRFRWIPYAAYTVAGSVALLRIANNEHYLSDVLVGAGIGILSQKIAYWTHQYRWGRHVEKPIMKF